MNKTKEELKKDLHAYDYDCIFVKRIINYLYSLIELEDSIIRDTITKEERKELSKFSIYREIASFNLYEKTLELLKNESGVNIKLKKQGYIATINQNDTKTKVLELKKNTIKLYQTTKIEEEEKVKTLNRIKKELNIITNLSNPYGYTNNSERTQKLKRRRQLAQKVKEKEYETMMEILTTEKILSKEDITEMLTVNKIYDKVLQDFGLIDRNFKEEKIYLSYDKENNLVLQKKLIYQKNPNIIIENNKKYL